MANISNNSIATISNATRGTFGIEAQGEMNMVNTKEGEVLYILLYTFAALIVLPGIFGNGFIIVAVSKIQSLKTPTNYLIASLAVADLLVVVAMVAFVLMDRFPLASIPLDVHMYLFPSIDMMLGTASLWNLAAVSIDRGIAVLRPFHYESLMNSKRVKICTTIIWSYSLLIFVFSISRIKFQSELFTLCLVSLAMILNFILPCVLIVIIYIGIFTSALKSIKVSKTLEKAIFLAINRDSGDHENGTKRRPRMACSREVRVAINVMIILVPLLVGWGFYFGTFCYEMITKDLNRSNIYEFCLLVIPWINSSLNPVVYILATASLRKGCRRIICGRRSPAARDFNSMFTTGILSNLSSRRPSWFERSTSISMNGERRNHCDSRRGSQTYRRKSSTALFLGMDTHMEEQNAVTQC